MAANDVSHLIIDLKCLELWVQHSIQPLLFIEFSSLSVLFKPLTSRCRFTMKVDQPGARVLTIYMDPESK